MDAALQIEAKIRANHNPPPPGEFTNFEKQSQRLLKLGFQLALAHRESMDSFLADSNRSLTYLRFFWLTSLALLLRRRE